MKTAQSYEVLKSKDYSAFKTFIYSGHFNVSEEHLDHLVKSIQEKNFLKDFPIIVNSKLEILDGNHRYYAAKRLNIPFYYWIISDAELERINKEVQERSNKWH